MPCAYFNSVRLEVINTQLRFYTKWVFLLYVFFTLCTRFGYCSKLSSRDQPYVIGYGEPTEFEMDLTPFSSVFNHFPKLKPAITHWNPNEEIISGIPSSAPVVIVTHITDDNHVDHPSPDGDPSITYSFKPIPPIAPKAALRIRQTLWKPGDAFVWGWPEPFPWLSDASVHLARPLTEFFYPFRHIEVLMIASCYSKRAESSPFNSVVGFEDGLMNTFQYPDGYSPSYGRLGAAIHLYNDFFFSETHSENSNSSPNKTSEKFALQPPEVISDTQIILNSTLRAYSVISEGYPRKGQTFVELLKALRGDNGTLLDRIWTHFIINLIGLDPKREDIRNEKMKESLFKRYKHSQITSTNEAEDFLELEFDEEENKLEDF